MATSKSKSEFNFNRDELKKQMSEFKEAYSKAKKEHEEKEKNGEIKKEPLGKKILGIIIIIVLVIGTGFVLFDNLDLLFLPKNSITIIVKDQNGEAINGLKVNLESTAQIYNQEFEDIPDITILSAIPGDYTLHFSSIPDGYTCHDLFDNFTLKENGKVKLEYVCEKDN